MATQDIVMTEVWQLAHSATADNTNVVLTPQGKGIDWAIDTSTPAETLAGHNLSQMGMINDNYRDRGFVLQNGEGLYVRGSAGLVVAMTIAT